ncbi:MAG TPA: lytic transglycosylase domain-containing protein [Rugosimonospora sp.]|nr:lytic transglycosylase domain-containing protein [Rugosimonospora sp.]
MPLALVQAVGWQETGWQSNLVSCIGAIGVMQLTATTADWMNQRFGLSYDVHAVAGNAALGSAYLQWLVKYFGDVYFNGNYDLTVVDPNNPTLLDAVISAYNVGFGAVDTKAGLKIPNRTYVNNVEYFMTKAPWG